MAEDLEQLELERARLLQKLAGVGDMRRGSITEVYRRCGKENCGCVGAGHPGHGPYYAYTVKAQGKTKTLQMRPGPVLSKIEREVKEYKEFRSTSDRVVEVSEKICEARPVRPASAEEKKRRFTKPSKRRLFPRSKRS